MHHRPEPLRRSRPLTRLFDLDLKHGSNRLGEMKIIAAIIQLPVIEKIRTHLGMQGRAPPCPAARPWPGAARSLSTDQAPSI